MSRHRLFLLSLLAALVLAGCFTGERPTFATQQIAAGTPTGDAAIDALLTRLDAAASTRPTFTAGYDLLTRFGNVERSATVVSEGRNRAVTIGSVRFVETGSGSTTCMAEVCTDGLRAQAISDTQLTFSFYGADAAARLRVDARSKIGPTTSRAETIAGQSAACVDVLQANNTAVYCVLESGVLARLDDADVKITLTAYSPTADASEFSTAD